MSLEEALVVVIPSPPVFTEHMESVAARVKKLVRRIRIPKSLAKPHRLIARLLNEDKARQQKNIGRSFSFDEAIFTTAFERRRLKILNSLFVSLELCGMKPFVDDKVGRTLSVTVGDQDISFTLDSVRADKQLIREQCGYSFAPRGVDDPMILKCQVTSAKIWKDTDTEKIEDHIREIVEQIIIAGEVLYRERAVNHHNWLIDRKKKAEKEVQNRLEEAERQHLEHIRKLEEQNIKHLLGQAAALRQASEIRTYVEAAQKANTISDKPISMQKLEAWSSWALVQADRIDPVKSGDFHKFKIVRDEEDGLDEGMRAVLGDV
ncbi:MAG: hypothetical protein PHW76_08085 [Alphaproteobacteria bacterium]|nr:hypothetical protein [Alphaproteobacteria bacterium]